jgi:cytochrome b involved in lipid metabolism
VQGKVYDLSKFEHPGGPVALQLAKNRDCDDLIRSYHPFTEEKVRAVLAKYEVKGMCRPRCKHTSLFALLCHTYDYLSA